MLCQSLQWSCIACASFEGVGVKCNLTLTAYLKTCQCNFSKMRNRLSRIFSFFSCVFSKKSSKKVNWALLPTDIICDYWDSSEHSTEEELRFIAQMKLLNGRWYEAYKSHVKGTTHRFEPKLVNLPQEIISHFWQLMAFHTKYEEPDLVQQLENLSQRWKILYEHEINRTMKTSDANEMNHFQDGLPYRILQLYSYNKSITKKSDLRNFFRSLPTMFTEMHLFISGSTESTRIEAFIIKQLTGPWLRKLKIWYLDSNVNIDKELLAFCTSPKFFSFVDYRHCPMSADITVQIARKWETEDYGDYTQNRQIEVKYKSREAEKYATEMELTEVNDVFEGKVYYRQTYQNIQSQTLHLVSWVTVSNSNSTTIVKKELCTM
ncbi:hypothetical protein L596_010465 [Steinernema carpocapsae]|uniref:Uncharacterized protein n=1 Tax=Steinernema carpocapsae TaxID=34508 RepID=A0A4U5PIQ5_STECR|nr:hypothetical protein L596_010465 [Steinernema carpocapsae]